MTGFQAPNYTQVPNDYFDLVMEMTESENKVLAVLLRTTLGYHRDEIKLSIRELARITHLDPKSVMNGARKLEERGLIERTVGKITTVTRWRVVIEDPKLWEKIVKTVPVSQYGNETPPLIKKERKDIERRALDFQSMTIPEARKLPTLRMYEDATDFFPGSVIWEFVHTFITENKLTAEKIKAAAVAWAAQGFKKENVKGILEWALNGIPEKYQTKNMQAKSVIPKSNMRELDDNTPIPYVTVEIGD